MVSIRVMKKTIVHNLYILQILMEKDAYLHALYVEHAITFLNFCGPVLVLRKWCSDIALLSKVICIEILAK